MKRILPVLALLMVAQSVSARNVLIDVSNMESGGFGGPQFGVAQFNGALEPVAGGGGAWLINRQFYLGMRGSGILARVNNEDISFGYGGLWAGYIVSPDSLFNMSFDLLLGGGGVHRMAMPHDESIDGRVAIIEPSAALRLNLATFASVSLGASYRFAYGSTHATLTDEDMRGAGLFARFEFGKF